MEKMIKRPSYEFSIVSSHFGAEPDGPNGRSPSAISHSSEYYRELCDIRDEFMAHEMMVIIFFNE